MGEKVRPRIGVVWGGSRLLKNDGRSILFDQFRSLISDVLVPGGADWICLQNQLWPADAEAAANGSGVRYVGDQLKSFGDTAALIEQMDLVVTVDTSVAHLAGAMGKPVWIMLMFNADWRWLLGRDDSPWYPSARLFRQAQPGDWTSVLEDVRQTLPKFLEGLG